MMKNASSGASWRLRRRARFPLRKSLLAGTAAIFLTACAAEVHIRGNKVEDDVLAQIEPGRQSREQVVEMLGSPSSVAVFDSSTILYISQRTRTVTFHEPEVLSRTVVAFRFDERGIVQEIARLDLDDGRPVDPVDRTTPTPGRQFTLLQQLIGNFGRFETGEEQAPE